MEHMYSRSTDVDRARQRRINHAARIDKTSFLALFWTFTAVALITCIARISFRIYRRRKVLWDDFFVVLGAVTLLIATVCFQVITDLLYFIEVMEKEPTFKFTPAEKKSLASNEATTILNVGRSLLWVANFAIKASFLVVFRTLVRDISRLLNYYYWFSVIYTTLSFCIILSWPWIICPVANQEQFQCLQRKWYLYQILMTFVNISTDALIVSIPFLFLRNSRLRISQKLRIAFFLCLSLFMVIICLVRLISCLNRTVHGHRESNIVYTNLLLQIESATAVIMGSISAFSAIFIARDRSDSATVHPSWWRQLWSRTRLGKKSAQSNHWNSMQEHPHLSPGDLNHVTLGSLKGFIRRYNREPGHTTIDSMVDPLEDYHLFVRRDTNQISLERGSSSKESETKSAV